ncbi:CopD family protein [Sulfurospirillum arcachonense]|uniref:CopD family protein n=1 Tax=Sulfurospirillum arcachonense TaxID=57666 RepID=UPI000469AC2F|nr:CopD family protein [Sulfurospirillum arcachonense]
MEYYTYILTFHFMSVMSWMAVMFYLPRLFVYHKEHSHKKEFVQVVEIQEYKLYKYIGLPALWASIASGGLILYLNPYLLQESWMHLKILALGFLIIYSFSMEYYRVSLAKNECTKSGHFFRAYNEVPTLLSTLIVSYVVIKDSLLWYSLAVIIIFGFIIYKIATLKD